MRPRHKRPTYKSGVLAGALLLVGALAGAWSEGEATLDPLAKQTNPPRVQRAPLLDRSAQRFVVEVELHIPEPEPAPKPQPAAQPDPQVESEPEPEPEPEKPEYRHYEVGPVKPHVQAAANEIGTIFGVESIGGVSERSGPSEHPLGLALDFMCDKATGDAIVAHIAEHRERLAVDYVIWQQQINSFDGRGWRLMEDRGNPTANHYDHVHVSFLDI